MFRFFALMNSLMHEGRITWICGRNTISERCFHYHNMYPNIYHYNVYVLSPRNRVLHFMLLLPSYTYYSIEFLLLYVSTTGPGIDTSQIETLCHCIYSCGNRRSAHQQIPCRGLNPKIDSWTCIRESKLYDTIGTLWAVYIFVQICHAEENK